MCTDIFQCNQCNHSNVNLDTLKLLLLLQILFQNSERLELDSIVYVIKILFNLNSQVNEKFELFSQLTYEFQNLVNETLFITDHKNVKKFAFDWLAAKLWNKESIILWNVCIFE